MTVSRNPPHVLIIELRGRCAIGDAPGAEDLIELFDRVDRAGVDVAASRAAGLAAGVRLGH